MAKDVGQLCSNSDLLPVSADFIERVQRMALPCVNILCRFDPLEGLRLFIVLRQIVMDRSLQIIDAGEAATSDAPWPLSEALQASGGLLAPV